MTNKLDEKRAAVDSAEAIFDAAQAAIARHSTDLQNQQNAIAREQAKLIALQAHAGALYETRAKGSAQLDATKEAYSAELVVNVSGLLVRLHAIEPVEYYEKIQAAAIILRSATRSELDTPISAKYFGPHPVVKQAIAFAPARSELDTPVFELGAAVPGLTDWASRRDRLIPQLEQLHAELTRLMADAAPRATLSVAEHEAA
jgi:multidrug efflux pump subunit AcrA (membrane-fusion protein)